ncbi:oligosaccharide repeat unit polymerase [uncultured Draconibacterium sp.]|uniref:O-antigen ligase family protein n=1 Tax=uncultured Draconibacterium sp. TaxID=1573823 RepID=UPI0032169807
MKISITKYFQKIHLPLILIIGSLYISLISNYLGPPNMVLTAPVLFVGFAMSIYLIHKTKFFSQHFNLTEQIFFLFTLIYFSNLFIDTILLPQKKILTSYATSGMLLLYITCFGFITSLSVKNKNNFDEKTILRIFFFLGTLGMLIALPAMKNVVRGVSQYDTGRADVGEGLNAITMGRFSISIFIIAFYVFLKEKKVSYRILSVFSMLLCLLVAALTGSRGPFVTLALVILFFFLVQKNTKNVLRFMVVSLLLFVLLKGTILNFLESRGASIFIRMEQAIYEQNFSGRTQKYLDALHSFQENPIFGHYFVLDKGENAGGHPHNLLLEVLITTGLLGIIPFLYILLSNLKKSVWVISKDAPWAWIHLLSIQYILASMFSFSLTKSPGVWILIYFVASYNKNILKQADSKNE